MIQPHSILRPVPGGSSDGGQSRRPPGEPRELYQDWRGLHWHRVYRYRQKHKPTSGCQKDGPSQATTERTTLQRGE